MERNGEGLHLRFPIRYLSHVMNRDFFTKEMKSEHFFKQVILDMDIYIYVVHTILMSFVHRMLWLN